MCPPPTACIGGREGGASSRPALQHLILQRLRGLPSVVFTSTKTCWMPLPPSYALMQDGGITADQQNGKSGNSAKRGNQEFLQNRKSRNSAKQKKQYI